jgi:hypothetical protein
MSNKIRLNKHGQYYPRPSYSAVHPVFIIGIIILCTPLVTTAFRVKLPGIISTPLYVIGLVTVLIGSYLSIMKAVDN